VVHDKSPYFQFEGTPAVDKDQQKGLALVPKLALNVSKCVVAQVLRLTQNSIIPLRFNVPRKVGFLFFFFFACFPFSLAQTLLSCLLQTYSIFHDDLFPDTKWTVPGMTADEWLAGENNMPPKYPVDPAKRPSKAPAAAAPSGSSAASSSVAAAIEITQAGVASMNVAPSKQAPTAQAPASSSSSSSVQLLCFLLLL